MAIIEERLGTLERRSPRRVLLTMLAVAVAAWFVSGVMAEEQLPPDHPMQGIYMAKGVKFWKRVNNFGDLSHRKGVNINVMLTVIQEVTVSEFYKAVKEVGLPTGNYQKYMVIQRAKVSVHDGLDNPFWRMKLEEAAQTRAVVEFTTDSLTISEVRPVYICGKFKIVSRDTLVGDIQVQLLDAFDAHNDPGRWVDYHSMEPAVFVRTTLDYF